MSAFNFYAVPIFQVSCGSVNPHLAAVVTGSVQLLASSASGVLSDTVGRLPLLVASTVLMSAALAGFGFFSFYQSQILVSGAGGVLDWIPLVCVVLFVAAFSVGLNPISWLLVGEMFPLEYRSVGPSVATAFSYVCAFIGVKTFVDLREHLGLHGTFWTYAAVSTVGLAFVLLFVPETKGTILDEMVPRAKDVAAADAMDAGDEKAKSAGNQRSGLDSRV